MDVECKGIATRNVIEGWIYVACNAFPQASLAHASGWEKPRETVSLLVWRCEMGVCRFKASANTSAVATILLSIESGVASLSF